MARSIAATFGALGRPACARSPARAEGERAGADDTLEDAGGALVAQAESSKRAAKTEARRMGRTMPAESARRNTPGRLRSPSNTLKRPRFKAWELADGQCAI